MWVPDQVAARSKGAAGRQEPLCWPSLHSLNASALAPLCGPGKPFPIFSVGTRLWHQLLWAFSELPDLVGPQLPAPSLQPTQGT